MQALFTNSWILESFLIFLYLELCAKEAPLRIYQANWFQKRVTILMVSLGSIQLMHIFVSDCCNLGRKKRKGFFFFNNNLMSCCMLIKLMCCYSESQKVMYSQTMLIWLSVYLELEIMEFLVWHFCSAHLDLIPCGHMKGLLFSFNNSVATVYFTFVLSCYEFLHQTLPRNVPKYSAESNSPHLEVSSGNNLRLSCSCHLSIQTISQVLLRNSSNFLWSSVFILWFAEV